MRPSDLPALKSASRSGRTGDEIDEAAERYLSGFEKHKQPKAQRVNTVKKKRDEEVPEEKGKEEAGVEEKPELLEDLGLLEQLKAEIEEFEKIREAIKAQIESAVQLLPKLAERKGTLEKEVLENEEKIGEIDELVPKLENKKKDLLEEVQRKQEERERLVREIRERQQKVDEIANLLPKLETQRKQIENGVREKEKEISKIDEQIRKISDLLQSFKQKES